jgi:uncharacterized membrane protein YeaQ/YmgE (transglycosylase-associated protein family)
MLEMGIIGWIVVGFIAGALSGVVFGDRTPRGCLPNIVIGVIGGVIGGFLARQLFDVDRTTGFLAAIAVALLGAVAFRFLLALVAPQGPRRR